MPKDVFLCHNSKEKAEVEKIRAQLLQEGIDAWLDKYDTVNQQYTLCSDDCTHQQTLVIKVTTLSLGLYCYCQM